jgi:hypothetical protein
MLGYQATSVKTKAIHCQCSTIQQMCDPPGESRFFDFEGNISSGQKLIGAIATLR